jgi:2-iminobutanoate/2-iminopropanoate deaminase
VFGNLKTVVKSEKLPKPAGPYSPAIRAGDYIFCAGQVGRDPATGEIGKTVEEQTKQVLLNLQSVLKAAGASLENAVKTTVFLADMNEFSKMNVEYSKFFPKDPPARSTVGVTMAPGIRVEIELVAYVGE